MSVGIGGSGRSPPTNGRAPAISWPYLVAQKLVDAGLRPRPFVDALDDHSAGEARAAVAARQATGHDDGIFGHPTVMNLAARTVDDLGGGAEEHAHRQYRTALDDHPLGDFRPRA